MVCLNCNNIIKTDAANIPSCCPFCGAEISGNSVGILPMYTAVRRLTEDLGRRVILRSGRLTELLAERVTGMDAEKKVLKTALGERIGRFFLDSTLTRERCIAAVKQRLMAALSPTETAEVIGCIAYALGWEDSIIGKISYIPPLSADETAEIERDSYDRVYRISADDIFGSDTLWDDTLYKKAGTIKNRPAVRTVQQTPPADNNTAVKTVQPTAPADNNTAVKTAQYTQPVNNHTVTQTVTNNAVNSTPVQNTPTQNTPVQNTPVQNARVQNTPAQNTPVQPVNNGENVKVSIPPRAGRTGAPVTNGGMNNTPVQNTPTHNTPVQTANNGGNVKVSIPPRAGRTGAPVTNGGMNNTPVQNTPTHNTPVQPVNNGGNVRMNIPPRADRTGNAVTGVSGRELSGVELAQRSESVVMIAVCDQQGNIIGNGSGIAVGANGFILTNCHVVRKGSGFAARFENDDRPYPVQVIKYHTINDMALLRVNRSLKPLPLYRGQRGELVRGQKVIAIGSPMGLLNTVSDGIISGFRKVGEIEAIQFTAPISPGSSGGALLNAYGELIGMCFGGIEDGQNLNLAINYKDIYPFISGFLGK